LALNLYIITNWGRTFLSSAISLSLSLCLTITIFFSLNLALYIIN